MEIHGASQTLILEVLKGLLDSGVDVLGGPFGQAFCPCGHGLHVLDDPSDQAFFPCGHALHVLGDGGEYALVDVLDDGEVGGHGIYSLSLTEQGVALDE